MINRIELSNIRKYENKKININKNLVIIIGSNGCGKTTILESIYLISKAKSHRTNENKDIIFKNKEFGFINITNENKKYKIILSLLGKKTLINNIEVKKISDFIGNLKCVLFSPNDLNLIYGSKSNRRSFLDIEISMINKSYIYEINNFRKLLKERNEILKKYNKNNDLILDVITKQFIESNKKIINIREKFIGELNIYFKKIHKVLYNEEVNILYKPSVTLLNIEEIFIKKLDYDIQTKFTNYGIHRDDFLIYINENNAYSYASQGQIRSLVLSLKIALFYMLKNKFGNEIILLLDDVFSELDINRQNNLIKFLSGENQIFISTTNLSKIPNKLLEKAQIINLEKEL